MTTIDLGFWVILATGVAIGITWERRDALVDWFASRLEPPQRPTELPRTHPAVRVLRDPYDWDRDGSA